MRSISVFASACIACLLALSSCSSSVQSPAAETAPNSFTLMQSRIFSQSCVQCHNQQDANINGTLDLADSAYANLVNAHSYFPMASTSGYPMRVVPSHPEQSYMIAKLTGQLGDSLGLRMPNDGLPLSDGKIEFIEQWIAAGAPRTGAVADTMLLHDSTVSTQLPVQVLPPPAHGFQLHLPTYDIPAGSEREIFVYQKNPATDTQYFSGAQISMRQGSHHFILYNVDGVAQGLVEGQIRDRTDKEMAVDRTFLVGSQTLMTDFSFPPGIAAVIPPNLGFDFNSHYVNTSDQPYVGEAYININTVDKSSVQHIATPFLWADTQFQIPASSTYTRSYYWPPFTKPTHLLLLASHAHKRMTSFKIYKGGPTGQLIYSSQDWQEPIVQQYNSTIDFQTGESLYSETTWENDSDHPVQFGFTTEDEMNVIVGYYWQ